MKKLAGWLLLVWGGGGILVNIVYSLNTGSFPPWLIINTLICIVLIIAGRRLIMTPGPAGGQL